MKCILLDRRGIISTVNHSLTLIRRSRSGVALTDFSGASDKKIARQFQAWLDRDTDFYPDHPVRLKEKWEVSKKLKKNLPFASEQQILAFCQLKKVKTIHGRQIAEIGVSVALMGTANQIVHVEVNLEGTAHVDLASGRVTRMDLSGDVQATGTGNINARDGKNVKATASGDGRMEFHQLCIPAPAPAAAPAPPTTAPSSTPHK